MDTFSKYFGEIKPLVIQRWVPDCRILIFFTLI